MVAVDGSVADDAVEPERAHLRPRPRAPGIPEPDLPNTVGQQIGVCGGGVMAMRW